jgi:tripartite-type tricarboxylate transporter receptor subunit TctC
MFRTLRIAGLLALAGAAPSASAFPDGPFRIVVAFPPGGANDVLARLLCPQLTARFNQPCVVENRPGAGGTVGTAAVAAGAADGSLLLLGSTGAQAVAPSLYSKLPYDQGKDLAPVSLMAISGNLVLVHPALPARSVRELIALARRAPDALSYASQGNGSTGHLATALFASMAGIRMVHVPYKGDALALVDVIAGNVPLLFSGIPPGLPHVKSGRLRLLAVTSGRRLAALPEVPTVAEAGLPGYDVTTWYGAFVPRRTNAAVVKQLAAEIANAAAQPQMRTAIANQGMEAAANTPAEFSALVERELERWRKLVAALGLRVD